jgi:hypothetical protein
MSKREERNGERRVPNTGQPMPAALRPAARPSAVPYGEEGGTMAQNYDPGRFLRLEDGRVLWWYHEQLLQLRGTSWVPPDRPVPLRLLRESQRLTPEELKQLEDSGVVLPKPPPS